MTSTPLRDHAPYFDRNTTNLIKGIALILMFIHHFFTFPSTFVEGIGYSWAESFSALFQEPTKMCVPVFAFLTGYVYYFQTQKTCRYSLKKIGDILIPYWVVFLVLLVLRTWVKQEFDPRKVVLEFLALRPSVMVFCWYVPFYCLTMLILPVLTKLVPKASRFMSVIMGILVPMVFFQALSTWKASYIIKNIFSSLYQWLPCVTAGYLFAQYDLFRNWLDAAFSISRSKWGQRLIWLGLALAALHGRRVLSSLELGCLIYRQEILPLSITMDLIYAPCFIYGIACLFREGRSRLHSLLEAIGRKSMLMWFWHCAFFNGSGPVTQPLLYFPRNPLLVLIWGLLLCYGASVITEKICRPLIRGKNKLLGM